MCGNGQCEGNSVFIDCGSTAERIAEALRNKKNITVIIQRFRIDYLFLGANGIDAKHGLTVPDYADAETKRMLIRQSRHVIVAADHAKLGGDFFEIVAKISEIEAVVTDSDAEPALVQELRDGGTEVIVV